MHVKVFQQTFLNTIENKIPIIIIAKLHHSRPQETAHVLQHYFAGLSAQTIARAFIVVGGSRHWYTQHEIRLLSRIIHLNFSYQEASWINPCIASTRLYLILWGSRSAAGRVPRHECKNGTGCRQAAIFICTDPGTSRFMFELDYNPTWGWTKILWLECMSAYAIEAQSPDTRQYDNLYQGWRFQAWFRRSVLPNSESYHINIAISEIEILIYIVDFVRTTPPVHIHLLRYVVSSVVEIGFRTDKTYQPWMTFAQNKMYHESNHLHHSYKFHALLISWWE